MTGTGHGLAVAEGLVFAAHWSVQRGHLNSADAELLGRILKKTNVPLMPAGVKRTIWNASDLEKLITADKKTDGAAMIDFIFIRRFGDVFIEKVAVTDVVAEAHRQGWVRP